MIENNIDLYINLSYNLRIQNVKKINDLVSYLNC